MESAGFKEWALICEALGDGRQTVLVRKGGIAEGRAGFHFRHAEFYLFPTFFHEQLAKTRAATSEFSASRNGQIEIRFCAKLEESAVVTSWGTAVALEPMHILQSEVVRDRFEYGEPKAIHVALVRVFRLSAPWIIPELPAYGGCRSWVQLPRLTEGTELRAVLSDAEHAARLEQFRQIVRATQG